MRYKRENVILIGLMPGPKEPQVTMNSFLQPLVQELNEFWTGVVISCPSHPLKNIYIRAALTCCACDIPATRKLCGFVGHNAKMGCSKCCKEFPPLRSGDGIHNQKRDFSGYDRSHWPIRSLIHHREQARHHLHAQTKLQQKCIEKDHGIRYSALLELPYWDPIRFSVVDPMHNLFLGTAKHALQIWIDRNIITRRNFHEMEQVVAKIITPQHVGRIPLKISSGFSGFTADQWRNWVTIFSPIALKNVLPPSHLCCWLLFVRACCLICNRIITPQTIEQIDQYLVQFCKRFEQLYGAEACTPNMHLHLHLKECLENYGPVHGFWCFGFERFNGFLGRYHTNNQAIEVQIMKKFLREKYIQALNPPPEAEDLFDMCDGNPLGSLRESNTECNDEIVKLQTLAEFRNLQSDYSIKSTYLIHLLSPTYKGVLDASDVQKIQTIYTYIYPNINISHFSQFYLMSKKCTIAGELFSSSSVITAFWPTESCNVALECELQVGHIQKFLQHTIKVVENHQIIEKTHIFCVTEWYIKHLHKNHFGSSAIMCTPITYGAAPCQLMPIQRISNRCAHGKLNVNILHHTSEQVMVAIPINLNYSL